jgi:hypothetical protein
MMFVDFPEGCDARGAVTGRYGGTAAEHEIECALKQIIGPHELPWIRNSKLDCLVYARDEWRVHDRIVGLCAAENDGKRLAASVQEA